MHPDTTFVTLTDSTAFNFNLLRWGGRRERAKLIATVES